MESISSFIKRSPLIAFFVLAYFFSWLMVALVSVSVAFALLALFGPALAAVIVTAVTEGGAGVKALLRKVVQWRVGLVWYVVVIGIPIVLALLVVGLHILLGGSFTVAFDPAGFSLALVLGVLVVGEEIGWRGYALPRMQARYGALAASLALGVLWAAWHLANATIPGLERYWYSFPAFLLFVVSQSVLFTWIANGTGGSVLMAWLFHAAINISGTVFFIGDQVRSWWLGALAYGAVALVVVLVTGPDLKHAPQARSEAVSSPGEPIVG